MPRILLTGSTGYIGSKLYALLAERFTTARLSRGAFADNFDELHYYVNSFSSDSNFSAALNDVDVVIHLAARAHLFNKYEQADLEGYRVCNTYATLSLAKQAAANGVKRFVFLSSIGVMGTHNSRTFTLADKSSPTDNYSISKNDAEIGLRKISAETGMELVIIRPPLVYGKAAPGNFGLLLKLANKNLPLPLGSINNQRSFVAIDNLIDLIITCVDHPNAAGETFLVSDDEDVSTSALLEKLIIAAGKNLYWFLFLYLF
ncbi:NAD-dependent epimerase/dehydratase family protein [Rheinheimera sp. MMS21-TC3]|uniref:NAD-dependent epimerase/dehydratase family protein n=1 Tax=Rheinheimera sp. MMS21-TC3 TaxID=3072790 RepID=UPI0028C3C1D9|nr:NAD-dependent epimerase/dehydratase family protein [Rheinheimera sp. MMS21-TC3]WNO61694.1 NAD-dependent epimerase/dehydratase family protein [Rheinheimera sp. MMS21-TC3]